MLSFCVRLCVVAAASVIDASELTEEQLAAILMQGPENAKPAPTPIGKLSYSCSDLTGFRLAHFFT